MLDSNLTKTTRQRQIFGQSETFLTVLEIEAGARLHVMAINMESLWVTGTITFGMFQFLSKLSQIQSYILDMLRSTRWARSYAYIDWTFRRAHPLFSAFNPRSLLRTRLPIGMFPSPVIESTQGPRQGQLHGLPTGWFARQSCLGLSATSRNSSGFDYPSRRGHPDRMVV